MNYGPPVKLFYDNGSPFKSKFFQDVLRILKVWNVLTTNYHPKINGKEERYNRKILAALRNYI